MEVFTAGTKYTQVMSDAFQPSLYAYKSPVSGYCKDVAPSLRIILFDIWVQTDTIDLLQ